MAGLDQTEKREKTWKLQTAVSLHLVPPPPSRSQPRTAAITQVYDVLRAGCRPTIIRNGLLFLFSIYGEPELLPMVTAAIKLLQGLRFTYRPCDLLQA